MLAFFHGQELGLVFGLAFAVPAALVLFVLFRWKTLSLFQKTLKVVFIIIAAIGLVFALDLLWIGIREIKDLYL